MSKVYDPGLYVNVYKNHSDWGNLVISRYYESPEWAQKNIDWDHKGFQYLFTAKVSSAIHIYDRPTDVKESLNSNQ